MARASWPSLTVRSERVMRGWRAAAISDRPDGDQLLAALGILVALYLVAVFLYFGKPGQFLNFLVAPIDRGQGKIPARLRS